MSLALLGQAIIKKVATKKIRILSKITDLKSKFDKGCPTTPELVKIINQRNQLVKILTQLKKQVTQIDKTTNPLKTLIITLTTATKLLKLAPLPVAFGSPAVALPLGTIVTAGNTLNKLDTNFDFIRIGYVVYQIPDFPEAFFFDERPIPENGNVTIIHNGNENDIPVVVFIVFKSNVG